MEHGRMNHKPDEPQHQLECLARHICNLPTLTERRKFIDRMCASRPPGYGHMLKTAVREEWSKHNE